MENKIGKSNYIVALILLWGFSFKNTNIIFHLKEMIQKRVKN